MYVYVIVVLNWITYLLSYENTSLTQDSIAERTNEVSSGENDK